MDHIVSRSPGWITESVLGRPRAASNASADSSRASPDLKFLSFPCSVWYALSYGQPRTKRTLAQTAASSAPIIRHHNPPPFATKPKSWEVLHSERAVLVSTRPRAGRTWHSCRIWITGCDAVLVELSLSINSSRVLFFFFRASFTCARACDPAPRNQSMHNHAPYHARLPALIAVNCINLFNARFSQCTPGKSIQA